MNDVPLARALLLWDSPTMGDEPRFAVRPLGHRDYDKYQFKVGACFTDWQNETHPNKLQLRLMIEVWHIAAFYQVPTGLMVDELLRIPEYRDMLADDCLPSLFRGERA